MKQYLEQHEAIPGRNRETGRSTLLLHVIGEEVLTIMAGSTERHALLQSAERSRHHTEI